MRNIVGILVIALPWRLSFTGRIYTRFSIFLQPRNRTINQLKRIHIKFLRQGLEKCLRFQV
jgi:hypothetical protein